MNKRRVVLIISLSLIVTAEVDAYYNWVHFGSSYYALTQNYGSWINAENEAEAIGGHLACNQ
jgi:hypothetical protein